MISFKLKNGNTKEMILSDESTEQRIKNAWVAIKNITKYTNKEIRVKTRSGESHIFQVNDIENITIKDEK